MRGWLIAALFAGAAGAAADGWQPLDGGEIAQTLSGRTVDYAGAWQAFRASGRTLYNAGRDSWGYWAVRGDRYCSMWPPSDLWACYALTRQGDRLRFIDEGGAITEGALRDRRE